MTLRPDSIASLTSSEAKRTGNEDINSNGKKISSNEDKEVKEEEDDFSWERRNITGAGGGNIGESRACAACKYQRRRCAPGCPLAQYFPAEKHQQFLNAHKLFGLRNLSKVLRNMKSPDKDEAIKAMTFEADVRANYPVHGCYGVVRQLSERIAWFENELNLVRQEIDLRRSLQFAANNNNNNNNNNFAEDGQEKENCCSSTSVDDALNFKNDPASSSGYRHRDDTFDNCISADRERSLSIVPKVKPETEKAQGPPQIDLKNAASQFSFINSNS